MTDSHHSSHDHHASHSKPHGRGGGRSSRRPWYAGWTAIVAVVLMLAGIAAYILSMDESIEPAGDAPPEPMPAAAE